MEQEEITQLHNINLQDDRGNPFFNHATWNDKWKKEQKSIPGFFTCKKKKKKLNIEQYFFKTFCNIIIMCNKDVTNLCFFFFNYYFIIGKIRYLPET